MLFRVWDPPAAPAFPAASGLSIPCRDASDHPMELGLGDEILAGHLLLTGGTGTGKTCLLKTLSDRCRNIFPDANFVFLDPKGDFWPGRRPGTSGSPLTQAKGSFSGTSWTRRWLQPAPRKSWMKSSKNCLPP